MKTVQQLAPEAFPHGEAQMNDNIPWPILSLQEMGDPPNRQDTKNQSIESDLPFRLSPFSQFSP